LAARVALKNIALLSMMNGFPSTRIPKRINWTVKTLKRKTILSKRASSLLSLLQQINPNLTRQEAKPHK